MFPLHISCFFLLLFLFSSYSFFTFKDKNSLLFSFFTAYECSVCLSVCQFALFRPLDALSKSLLEHFFPLNILLSGFFLALLRFQSHLKMALEVVGSRGGVARRPGVVTTMGSLLEGGPVSFVYCFRLRLRKEENCQSR